MCDCKCLKPWLVAASAFTAAFLCQPDMQAIGGGSAFAQEHTGNDSGNHEGGSGGQGGQGGHGGQGGQGGHHGGSGNRPPAHSHRSGIHGTLEEALSGPEQSHATGRYQGSRHVPTPPVGSRASQLAGHEPDTGSEKQAISGKYLANLNVARSLLGSEHNVEPHDDGSHEDNAPDGDDGGARDALIAYQKELKDGSADPVVAGNLLGSVAHQPVTPEVVVKLHDLLGLTVSDSDVRTIAAVAETQRLAAFGGKGSGAGHHPGDGSHGGPGEDNGENPPGQDPGQNDNDLRDPGSGGGFQLGRGPMANRRQCDDVAGRQMKSGERISGRNLNRLREINRYLWPGYMPDAGPSPIFILASFQEELEKKTPDFVVAGTYLGLVSARPLEPRAVIDIAAFLCASVSEAAAIRIATVAELQRQQAGQGNK